MALLYPSLYRSIFRYLYLSIYLSVSLLAPRSLALTLHVDAELAEEVVLREGVLVPARQLELRVTANLPEPGEGVVVEGDDGK